MREMLPKEKLLVTVNEIAAFLGVAYSVAYRYVNDPTFPTRRLTHKSTHPHSCFESELIEWKEGYDLRKKKKLLEDDWNKVPFTGHYRRACLYVIHNDFNGVRSRFSKDTGLYVNDAFDLMMRGERKFMSVEVARKLNSVMGYALARSIAGDKLTITKKKLPLKKRYKKAVADLKIARETHKEARKAFSTAERREKRLTLLVAKLFSEINESP